MKATKQVIATGIVAGIVGLAVGWGLGGSDTPSGRAPAAVAEQGETWTCSMHPQIRQPGPGQCPICAMDLIPVAAPAVGDSLGPRQLRLSPAAQQLASIQTAPVKRRFAPVETRMVGKIAVDETQVRSITAWVAGRIDRLYVDYTGVRVEEGDHIAYLYSPELLTAQEELIQALRAHERLVDSGTSVGQTAQAMVAAAREKLRLLGLKEEQIERVERERQASDHLTIYAPTGGVVIKKHLSEGAYVQTGTPIYTIADLSRLWLELRAYESDLSWIHFGQAVEFSAEAYPGEVFSGQISFVDPVLDERTRTVRVRVNVANEQGRLKPGMLVWGRGPSRSGGQRARYVSRAAGQMDQPDASRDRPRRARHLRHLRHGPSARRRAGLRRWRRGWTRGTASGAGLGTAADGQTRRGVRRARRGSVRGPRGGAGAAGWGLLLGPQGAARGRGSGGQWRVQNRQCPPDPRPAQCDVPSRWRTGARARARWR